ncbi:activity-regulated cytoskeleton associated protein 1-like [Musca domestica]|uniref:Activity-regulated cytoskeleton associated protein 1-like n=1 Tax=Musca domestica TaxID=7370 RepID=A0ABM3VH20_MUSDO|nr:activity-regulated cytoskeleton associated protein 1-like [Musca domestica]XP_058985090.1 activity-regulated cytoskeleton associated protein 1-like [Musca domestica]
MAQMVQMTTEQLQQLIEAVRISAANSAAQAAETVQTKSKGSFSNCPSRFGGQRDHEAVEEFITSIVTYKEIECISDEDALKGISLLFYGLASTWWQGVRKEAKSWNDVLALIRDHFSPTKPAYQIYMEIFEKKQEDSVAIDTFVCQKRALLAQLPDGRHDEETEIDLVYGLLNIKYRKHIARHDIKTFRELLEKGRIIEHNMMEDEAEQTGPVRGSKGTKRCTYCNFRGHTTEQCRKRKSAEDN